MGDPIRFGAETTKRDALLKSLELVLAKLPAESRLNLIAFGTEVHPFKPGLVPATYDFVVRKIGFAPQRRQVIVQIGATQQIDLSLQAGAVELQAVTVQAAAAPPAIEMRTPEVAPNVSQQQIEALPSPSRNFLDLAGLAPGVSVSEDRVNASLSKGVAAKTISAGGASANQVNVFVDGAMQSPEEMRGTISLVFDVGGAWVVGRNTQLDAYAGWGAHGATAPNVFVGAGISRRF